MMGPGIPLIITSFSIAIGVPVFIWAATGIIDRQDMSFLKRLWCVCGALIILGCILTQII